MSSSGVFERNLLVGARSVLLDALPALDVHRDSMVIVGAQVIYLRTAHAPVAVNRGDNGR
jgi:hypothetical protein